MLRSLILLFSISYSSVSVSLSQETDEETRTLDGELREAISDALPEADSFARSLQDAIDAARGDAEALIDSAQGFSAYQGGEADESGVDVDALLRQHAPSIERARNQPADALPFLVFVSLSMPPTSLKPLLEDVHRAGGVAVLRGFKDGSLKETASALLDITGEGEPLAGAAVDPRLFRSFGVKAVPTFIIPSGALGECFEPDCTAPAPPHDRIAGNVTVSYALRQLADHGEAAPDKAKQHLHQLEAQP